MLKHLIFLFTPLSLFSVTTLQVTQSTDNNPGGQGNMGELRYVLNAMNTDLNNGIDDEYKIVFDFPMTITLGGTLPIINNSELPVTITIGNDGPIADVIIDGGGTYRGFFIPTGNVIIQNMTLQNMVARGGNGGSGIAGGGGGLGAGGAIYAPLNFLNGSQPNITLMNVTTNECLAIGGNGGSYSLSSPTGDEGAGGGGGFGGNGGSVTSQGQTGGGGGGGFGGNGGNATTSSDDALGGGGGGGGGIGSRATSMASNLGNGGDDQDPGTDGNGYGLINVGGSGGGLYAGGNRGGGGGGGSSQMEASLSGGGGGGVGGDPMDLSLWNGNIGVGNTPPGGSAIPSGGKGADGGGGGGGGIVSTDSSSNNIDGQGGSGGYAGGGGGGAGTGSYDGSYTVQGGSGGLGGGGGGGGPNQSGSVLGPGGDSGGGGGGGGGGPSSEGIAIGGSDTGILGGGKGGNGAENQGGGFGGGGGGGGSGLGGAIFLDNFLNLNIQARSGVPTTFNTINSTLPAVQAGSGGSANGAGGEDGLAGSALGDSIFLRGGSSISLLANDPDDLLIIGDGVTFVDDSTFGGGGTLINVTGNGTVVYNGSSDYEGFISINNANFKVNGLIDGANGQVCRNSSLSEQRGTLSGTGTLTGHFFVNSGVISPDHGGTLTLGSLVLQSESGGSLGSLVHIEIDSSGTSLVSVNGTTQLAGILEIEVDPSAAPGTYTVLSSFDIIGTFDSVAFTGATPNYSLSYLPIGNPAFVQFDFMGFNPPPTPYPTLSTQGLRGNSLRVADYLNVLSPDGNSLGLTDQLELLTDLSPSEYQNALKSISPSRNSIPTFAAQNVMFMFSEALGSHFTKRRLAHNHSKNRSGKKTAFVGEGEFLSASSPSPSKATYELSQERDSQIWATNFDQFSRRNSRDQTSEFDFGSLGDSTFLAASKSSKKTSPRKTKNAPPKNTGSQIWGAGFGQFSNQNAQDQTPGFDFNSGGVFVAYDYGNTDEGCIGALAGYAYSSIHEQHSMGNSQINAGYLSVYGMKYFSDFFMDAAIWGEYMGVDQKRVISYPGFKETAKSSYHAQQIDLHFGTGYDFNINTGTIEPFALVDWVYEWDPSYSEKGAGPYNMKFSSRNSWMLRVETGLNGYNTTVFDWGVFIAQAKLSYVYKKPHNVGHLNATIVNAPSSFGVEAFTAEQSLISPGVELFWQANWNGYGSISYDGEFGSGYSSNQFYAKIGYAF